MLNTLKKKLNKKKGFTLMEMLIVVAIIAILIAIAIPTFSSQLNKARKSTDQANIRSAYAVMQASVLTSQSPTGTGDAAQGNYYMQKDGSFKADATTNAYKIQYPTSGSDVVKVDTVPNCPDFAQNDPIIIVVTGNGETATFAIAKTPKTFTP